MVNLKLADMQYAHLPGNGYFVLYTVHITLAWLWILCLVHGTHNTYLVMDTLSCIRYT